MTHYFSNVSSKDEALLLFKDLARTMHPLKGGDPDTWEEVTRQFKAYTPAAPKKVELVKVERLNFNDPPAPKKESAEPLPDLPERLKTALTFAKSLPGLTVELCGTWIWVTGNTLAVWKELSAAGFFYSQKKNACYFRLETNKVHKRSKREMKLDQIKEKYGVKEIF